MKQIHRKDSLFLNSFSCFRNTPYTQPKNRSGSRSILGCYWDSSGFFYKCGASSERMEQPQVHSSPPLGLGAKTHWRTWFCSAKSREEPTKILEVKVLRFQPRQIKMLPCENDLLKNGVYVARGHYRAPGYLYVGHLLQECLRERGTGRQKVAQSRNKE